MTTQMTINPKYSFVMPAYKGRFIREAISSILCQSYDNFELIVVDDASPDDIKSIVCEFQDKRIRYYKNSFNIGFENLVKQWNLAIQYACGDWIILATDDDLYEPQFLKTADDLLTRYPLVDVFRARICTCDSVGNVLSVEPCLPEFTSFEEFMYMVYFGLNGGIPQYVYRKDKLLSLGGFEDFPKAWASDDYTSLLMSRNGVVCSGEVLTLFRCSGLNISTGNKYIEDKLIACFLYFEKVYLNLLSFKSDDTMQSNFYSNKMKKKFAYMAKCNILSYFYRLSLFKRLKYIRYIWEYMPYLDKTRKYMMCCRVFIRK